MSPIRENAVSRQQEKGRRGDILRWRASLNRERLSPLLPFGLSDMIGNVWEWTTDWYQPKHPADAVKACCVPSNPLGPRMEGSYDPCQPEIKIPRKVLKGGSHLCAPNYCRRYRPAARFPEPVDTSACHIGFRCIVRPAPLER